MQAILCLCGETHNYYSTTITVSTTINLSDSLISKFFTTVFAYHVVYFGSPFKLFVSF